MRKEKEKMKVGKGRRGMKQRSEIGGREKERVEKADRTRTGREKERMED